MSSQVTKTSANEARTRTSDLHLVLQWLDIKPREMVANVCKPDWPPIEQENIFKEEDIGDNV